MSEKHNDDFSVWCRWTDEDGEEHMEKIMDVAGGESCSFSLGDANDEENETNGEEYTAEDVKNLCARTLREKYFLEGMVHAYERVLLIDFDDDDEE